ncbi:MAG TPA: hypothetical protein VGC06_03800 [Actinomycetes bacterium]
MADEATITTSSLTELRQAALGLWKRERQDLDRTATRQAAERALDLFGDTAGPLTDPESWSGNGDGDATAIPALDNEGLDRLEYDHTFDEQLWLRSSCPACRGSARITPVSSLLELGQALDGLQGARAAGEVDADSLPGACDDCDDAGSPAQRLYRAVLAVVEEDEDSDDEDEDLSG